jgi:thioredoxin-like negative regulator of GroEL
MRPSSSSLERLADAYYAPPLADLQRSEPGYEDKDFQAAMEAFNTENWKRAAGLFSQIKTDHPGYEQAQYFLAHALAGEKQYEHAKELFDKMSVENGAYEQQAEWNRALMELYLNYPKNKIIDALQGIADDNEHFYQDKAKELVSRLE